MAEARLKAKQDYLNALAEQRKQAGSSIGAATGGIPKEGSDEQATVESKLSKREKMLEEKRLQFISKQQTSAKEVVPFIQPPAALEQTVTVTDNINWPVEAQAVKRN